MANQPPPPYHGFGLDGHLGMQQAFEKGQLHANCRDMDYLHMSSGHALEYLDASQQYNDDLNFTGDSSIAHSSLRAVDTATWCQSLLYPGASGANEAVLNWQRQQGSLSNPEDAVLHDEPNTTTGDYASSSTAISCESPNDVPTQASRTNDTGDDKSEDESQSGKDGTDGLINSLVAKQRRSRQLNTAASARFRMKRKQREEDLTNKLEDMTSKFTDMKDSVTRLTTEKDLLRDLLMKSKGGAGLSSSRQRSKKPSRRRMSKD